MTIGEGNIKQRLLSVRMIFFTFSENSFPEFLRNDWMKLKKTMTSGLELKNGEGVVQMDSIQGYLYGRKKRTLSKHVSKLVQIQQQLRDYLED
ncbi:MAG: hypothetical protein ABJH98_16810 [Reichenbachiella sp.]|uniref:hypothetical protein n=1 Tax=Reichenbachiella sp. TaxID=2184521 RepID=UPI003297FF1C